MKLIVQFFSKVFYNKINCFITPNRPGTYGNIYAHYPTFLVSKHNSNNFKYLDVGQNVIFLVTADNYMYYAHVIPSTDLETVNKQNMDYTLVGHGVRAIWVSVSPAQNVWYIGRNAALSYFAGFTGTFDSLSVSNFVFVCVSRFVTPPRNRGGVIFLLQFVCLCVSVCLSVCVCLSVRLLTKCRSNRYTDVDAVFAK